MQSPVTFKYNLNVDFQTKLTLKYKCVILKDNWGSYKFHGKNNNLRKVLNMKVRLESEPKHQADIQMSQSHIKVCNTCDSSYKCLQNRTVQRPKGLQNSTNHLPVHRMEKMERPTANRSGGKRYSSLYTDAVTETTFIGESWGKGNPNHQSSLA